LPAFFACFDARGTPVDFAADQWARDAGIGAPLHRTAHLLCGGGAVARDEGIFVVADARIDARDDLASALGLSKDVARAATSAGLILAAWRKWDEDCPAHLLGDYAFAIWDDRQKRLFCARDPLGVRPFFYFQARGCWFMSSSQGLLLRHPWAPDTLDERGIAQALLTRAPGPADRTLIAGLHRLPPAHSLTITEGTSKTRRYWRPERSAAVRLANDEAYAERLRELMQMAVADRLEGSEGGLGTHVSGGLDSSSVAAIAVELCRAQGRSLPVGFAWAPSDPAAAPDDDAHWIAAMAAHLGIAVETPAFDPDALVQALRNDAATGACGQFIVHEHAVQRAARERGVRVILSGWGGDEAISCSGVGHVAGMLRSGQWRQMLRERPEGASTARFILAQGVMPTVTSWRRAWVSPLARPHAIEYSFIAADFLAAVKPYPIRTVRHGSVRQVQLDRLFHGHITQRIENWAESGAAHGVEYRYPLLDRRILEFAYGLPDTQYRRGPVTRLVMRNALRGLVPDVVRLNPLKTERARDVLLDRMLRASLPRIGAALREDGPDPRRARFVDVQRLIGTLTDLPGDRVRPAAMFSAIGILGPG